MSLMKKAFIQEFKTCKKKYFVEVHKVKGKKVKYRVLKKTFEKLLRMYSGGNDQWEQTGIPVCFFLEIQYKLPSGLQLKQGVECVD